MRLDGRRLKEARSKRLMTVRELAAATGASTATITKLEQNKQTARFTTIKRLAAALGVDPLELMVPGDATEQE